MTPGRARVGVVTSGASYHERTLADPRFAPRLARALYLPALARSQLEGLDAVVVSDRQHPGMLARHASSLLGVPGRGGTLVVLGENRAHTWLPGVEWEARETNFWWWREGVDPGIRPCNLHHSLWRTATVADLTWHFHGVLRPPPGATPLLVVEREGSPAALLYEDEVSTPGRLIVTTLDPVYHHGSNFMPAATRCLDVLLSWLGT